MDVLAARCDTAGEYPKNLVTNKAEERLTNSYFERLNEEEHRIFQTQTDGAALNFWDCDDRVFWPKTVNNAAELRTRLLTPRVSQHQDPRCSFVHAPNSRDKLLVTRNMLMLFFTYHGIMPEFLDLLFGFGVQDHAQDFHYSTFHQRNRICEATRGLEIPSLGRSGFEIQFCYILKSVEISKSQQAWPWSIRQSAVCHCFDVQTGRMTWVVVKADEKLKDRIQAATGCQGMEEAKSFAAVDESFSAALAAHKIISDLSAENWRWYINFLESKFQAATRRALSSKVEKSSNLLHTSYSYSPLQPSPSQFEGTVPALERRFTELSKPETIRSPQPPQSQPCSVNIQEHPEPQEPLGSEVQVSNDKAPDFSFTDLQNIQHIEEKATEALLVLKTNVKILIELRNYYQALSNSIHWPEILAKNCGTQIEKFQADIIKTEKEHRMHQLRVEALISLIGERKSLGSGILDFQNKEANRILASQAQISASNVEAMTWRMHKLTESMHGIAHKTKQETVSMKIITLVTLFFLPGTFISVGLITLMSTGIFEFSTSGPGVLENILGPPNTLWFFLVISLPLVLMTFIAWVVIYRWTIFNGISKRIVHEDELKNFCAAV